MEHENVTEIAPSPTRWPCVAIAATCLGLVAGIGFGCQTSSDRSDETVVTQPEEADELPTADQHHQPQQPETDIEGQHLAEPEAGTGEDGVPSATAPDQPATHEPAPEADPSQSVQPTSPDPSATDSSVGTDDAPPEATGDQAAQTGPPADEPPRESPSAAPDADTQVPTSPGDVSDATAQSFAAAYIDVVDLQADYEPRIDATSDPEDVAMLQQQLEAEIDEAIEKHDLSLAEFNAIADLLEADETLRDRIQSEVDELAH